MTHGLVSVEIVGKVGIIRLNNPEALNAMSLDMVDDLNAALHEVVGKVGALILGGEGRAFCSGADLSKPMGGDDETAPDVGSSLDTHAIPLMLRMRELPIPWISAVRGAAAGYGASLALSADMVVASESAFFLLAFSRIGLVPDGGATYLLARSAGRVRAMEAALLGNRLPAAKAEQWGLINRVVEDAQLETVAIELATQLAEGPYSLKLIRKLVWDAVEGDFSSTMKAEREFQREAGVSDDFREGVAAFLEKRPAAFTGR
ncbi:MAG: enoyl-CoA hydratase-related protein [Pseudomonadota bacterium]